MKFLSDKHHGDSRKISFSDIDDWGYTSKGIIVTTDHDYLITGLELYTAKHGVIRCDQSGNITYCHGWEKDHVKQGIGVSSHFATKLIDNDQESHELFEKIYDHILQSLEIPCLRKAIHDILKDKKKVMLEPALFNIVDDKNGIKNTKSNEKSDPNDSLKKPFLGRLWPR